MSKIGKYQNAWADIEDELSTTAGNDGLVLLANFFAFVFWWISSGSFLFAVIVTPITYGGVGALALLIVHLLAAIFSRRW
jgi:DMSO/TMAO reductase YedYZ heme-binding membrane subunit